MEPVTYSQLQQVIQQLPEAKLGEAYRALVDLLKQPSGKVSPHSKLRRLPLEERRRVMAEQATQLLSHYERTGVERDDWQAGDFANEN
jgi:hypothetical protein